MKRFVLLPLLALAACETPVIEASAPQSAALDVKPVERPAQTRRPPPPPPTARTVEQFDTTTAEDRAEALAVQPPAGERVLGTTNVSLGSPTDPGIWLKTALVSEVTPGRVAYGPAGTSVNIELRPSGGVAGSASQMSLAAMRLLQIPLTALADVTVFAD